MDLHGEEITIDDFKNYNDDISKFMMLQQIESGRFFLDLQDDHAFEFRSTKDEQ